MCFGGSVKKIYLSSSDSLIAIVYIIGIIFVQLSMK